jgi:hypothetical protein
MQQRHIAPELHGRIFGRRNVGGQMLAQQPAQLSELSRSHPRGPQPRPRICNRQPGRRRQGARPKDDDVLRPSDSTPAHTEVTQAIASHRASVERIIAHLKNWELLATGYRGLLNRFPDVPRHHHQTRGSPIVMTID